MKNEIGKKIAQKVYGLRAKAAGLSAMAAIAMSDIAVRAQDVAGGGTGGNDAKSMVNKIAEIVVDIFPLVGIFFVISGVFKLIMAYRNDQPEGQAAAAKDIVIGVVFIVFRAFAWPAVSGVIG